MRPFPEMTIQTALRSIDVSGFTPVVMHPASLRLGQKTQLSCVDQIFPGARHSRREHSLFVFHFLCELCRYLVEKQLITEQERLNLQIAALLHDVEQPPFSHAIEEVLGPLINPEEPLTHHQKARELFFHGTEIDSQSRTIHEAIRHCGGDPKLVANIVLKRIPIAAFISHNTLGVDKLAYPLLGSHHTGFCPQLPYMLDMLPWYCYQDGGLGICETKLAQVMNLQRVIQDMYEYVYYEPRVRQYVRMLQKATQLEVTGEYEAGVCLLPQEVWNMSEGALLGWLQNSRCEAVKDLAQRYVRQEPFSIVLELRHPAHFADDLRVRIEPELVEAAINKYSNPLNLTRLENAIEKHFNLPEGSVLVVFSGEPRRLVPEDVVLYDTNARRIDTLFERYPDHRQSLIERANAFFGLKVYADEGAMAVLSANRDQLQSFILRQITET